MRLLLGIITAFNVPGSSRAFEAAGWCLAVSPWVLYYHWGVADFFRSEPIYGTGTLDFNDTCFKRRSAGQLVVPPHEEDGVEGADPLRTFPFLSCPLPARPSAWAGAPSGTPPGPICLITSASDIRP